MHEIGLRIGLALCVFVLAMLAAATMNLTLVPALAVAIIAVPVVDFVVTVKARG